MADKVRIDKWLWAVRLFKTRTQATDACNEGKVRIGDEVAKPAKSVEVGQTVTVRKNSAQLTYKVEAVIEKRVGAPQAQACYEDLTPEEEKAKLSRKLPASAFYLSTVFREKGKGRPTKKDRRDQDRLTPDW